MVDIPFPYEFSHLLLHLFALQLFLEQNLEARYHGRPLRVLLIGLETADTPNQLPYNHCEAFIQTSILLYILIHILYSNTVPTQNLKHSFNSRNVKSQN